MDKELIVSVEAENIRLAMLEDGRLMELHVDEPEKEFTVGDIYLGTVKKTAPGLNAAFIDIGYEKDAFLHYQDLGRQLKSALKFTLLTRSNKQSTSKLDTFTLEKEIEKEGNIENILAQGQKILVQVTKEPISTKGPRITSEISIAGRYLVLVPFMDKISISQKIKDKGERDRLLRLMNSIKPKGFGIIIRTVAKNKKVAELHSDLNYLITKWNQCFNNLKNKQKLPVKILSEMDRASSILRDLFDDSFTQIVCNDTELTEDIRNYVEIINPEKRAIVKDYNENTPLFEKYSIEKQIKTAFGKTVTMAKGAYLIIEHTEALHVIDVNSGNSAGKNGNQEDNALSINKIAATEIARQLRLRDMGGIIVVDSIDMKESANRQELYDHFRAEMQKDRARHKILPPSKFGLIQITRQRVRPIIDLELDESQTAVADTSADLLLLIENQLSHLVEQKYKKLYLHIHPFVASYLKKGIFSTYNKWKLKYTSGLKIIERDAFGVLEFKFFNQDKIEL